MRTLRVRALVIGGGPAGSIAARALARSGMDTALIEKDLSFVKPCGGGIPRAVFDRLDIPPFLISRTLGEMRIIAPSGYMVSAPLGAGREMGVVDRAEFDPALRGLAADAGARIVEARFIMFTQTAKTTIAQAQTTEGEMFTIEADHVIAADGVNSRAAIGIGASSAVYTISLKRKGPIDDMPEHSCEFWFGRGHAPGFYSWVFPSVEGVSIGTGSVDGRGLKAHMEAFIKRRAIGQCDLSQARVYRIPLWGPRDIPLVYKGVLFAGDSAGQVMPLTFEGIYYAMRSGMLAAEAVIEGRPAQYELAWKSELRHTFSLMRMLRSWFLVSDKRMEKFVRLFERPEVMNFALGVWTEKRLSQKRGLAWYISALRKL